MKDDWKVKIGGCDVSWTFTGVSIANIEKQIQDRFVALMGGEEEASQASFRFSCSMNPHLMVNDLVSLWEATIVGTILFHPEIAQDQEED